MKKIIPLLFLTLFLGTLFLPASTIKVSAQTASEITADKNRRTLFHMIACLNRDSTLDDDDDLTAPDDIFDSVDEEGKQYYVNRQEEVVGLDIDKSDGVMSCAEAITNGANLLTPNSVKSSSLKDVGNYLIGRIFGRSFATSSETIDMDKDLLNTKVAELVNEATIKMNNYASQISATSKNLLLQGRAIGLVKMCFDVYSSTNGQGSGDLAMELPGVGFFYNKLRKDVIGTTGSMASFLNLGGQAGIGWFASGDRNVYVGAIDTGYEVRAENTNDTWDNGVNFYPVGRDTPTTEGLGNGLADCDFVIENSDLLFNNIRISEDGGFENRDGTPLTGALAAAVTASEDLASEGTGAGDNCETAADFAFAFVLCPLLEISNRALGWLDNRIVSALNVDQSYYDGDVREAWGNIRNIAYILLIPIMLIMVIGTALQLSFVDPYTVKRALPRLFVAIIFIAISYNVCVLMIELVNGVGRGIAGVITAPFGGLEQLTLSNIFNPDGLDNGIFVGGALAGVGIAFLSGVTIWTLLSFIGVAVLALVLIFVLLSVRELLIVFLLVISPLAIIAWIFPGNDKPWKLWWGSFSKMLYIYPIIMAFLGTGRAFASVVSKAEGDAIVSTMTKLVAFIGPYFFIPKAFQMAGGAFANIAGIVNDKGKGIFDRQRKFRQNNMKGARDRNLSGNRFRNAPTGSLRHRINERTEQAALLKQAGYRPSRIGAAKRLHQTEEFEHIAKDPRANAVLANDDAAMAALQGRGTFQDAHDYLTNIGYEEDDATRIANELQLIKRDHGAATTKAMAVVQAAGSKTAFRGGPAEMFDAILDASDGDTQMAATLYAKARSSAEQAGRTDLAGYSYGEGLVQAQQLWNASLDGQDTSFKYNYERDEQGRIVRDTNGNRILSGVTTESQMARQANSFLINKVVDSKGAGQLLSGHGTSVKNVAEAMGDRVADKSNAYNAAVKAWTDGDKSAASQAAVDKAHREYMWALAETANGQDAASYISPENGREFANQTLSRVIEGARDPNTGKLIQVKDGSTGLERAPNAQELLEMFRGNDRFQQRRRELGRSPGEEVARNRGDFSPPTPNPFG